MSENINKENQEDEISLLDLFAVLIRYRKLIVFGTGIITVLTILWLFVVPVFFKKFAKQNAKVEYTIAARSIPTSIDEKLPNSSGEKDKKITPLYLATYINNRLPVLVEAVRKHDVFSDSKTEMTEYEFNTYVQGLLKSNKIKIEESPLGTDYTITLTVPINSIDEATLFVTEMIAGVDAEIQNYYLPLLNTLKQNTDVSIEKAMSLQTGSSDLSSLQTLQSFATDINEFLNSFTGFVYISGKPFVVPDGRGRIKKLVIIFLASFFVFVFIAFCKNAVANIKADPQSNKLITDAWNAGKKS